MPFQKEIWASGGPSSPVYVYNNLFYNFGGTTTPFYPVVCWDAGPKEAQYWVNNVVIADNIMKTGFIDAGNQHGPTYCGDVYMFNNTLQTSSNNYWIRTGYVSGKMLNSVTLINNHIINQNGTDNKCVDDHPNGCGLPQTFNYNANQQVFQTNTAAITQGYRESNYAQPTNALGATVDKGWI